MILNSLRTASGGHIDNNALAVRRQPTHVYVLVARNDWLPCADRRSLSRENVQQIDFERPRVTATYFPSRVTHPGANESLTPEEQFADDQSAVRLRRRRCPAWMRADCLASATTASCPPNWAKFSRMPCSLPRSPCADSTFRAASSALAAMSGGVERSSAICRYIRIAAFRSPSTFSFCCAARNRTSADCGGTASNTTRDRSNNHMSFIHCLLPEATPAYEANFECLSILCRRYVMAKSSRLGIKTVAQPRTLTSTFGSPGSASIFLRRLRT